MKFMTIIATGIIALIALMATPAAAGSLADEPGCPQTIAEGDAFTVHGTGAANGSVSLLVLGRHYFQTFSADPDSRGEFSLTLGPEETRNFSAGQYAFVIQDPGANRQYEIATRISGSGNITITDRGTALADLGTPGGLRPWVQTEVNTLMAASGREGVDDTFRAGYFFVELPSLRFDQERDPVTGRLIPDRSDPQRLVFTGTTNMGTENTLTARIRDASTGKEVFTDTLPAITPAGGMEPGKHCSRNTWHYSMDPARLSPGEYIITIGWKKETWCGTGTELFIVPDEDGPAGRLPPSSPFSLVNSGFRTGR